MRGPARRDAVRDVAFELLGEVGYDRLTVDAVAARAKASKASIYRWWPDRTALLADVVAHHFDEWRTPPDTGSLRGDLIALLMAAWEGADSARGRAFAGLMTAAAREPELAREVRERLVRSRAALHDAIALRAVERGELAPGVRTDLLHQVMHGLVFTGRLWAADRSDERFAAELADRVLIPLLSGKFPDR